MENIFAGFLLGLVSSGHCLGMCGPIAFFLGVHQLPVNASRLKKLLFFSNIGLGKAITYAFLGLIFGWTGHLLTRWSSWIGLSKVLPGLAGVLFVLTGLTIAGFIPRFEMAIHRLEGKLRDFFAAFKVKQDIGSQFVLGMMWGLLPCPMVLAPALGSAVAGAAGGQEGALRGFFIMFGFGLGTIPALSTSAFAANWLKRIQSFSPKAVGLSFVLLGLATICFSFIMSSGHKPCHH